MHDIEFCDALRPYPVVLLRLPLRPYSVGHELLLLREKNGLVLNRDFFEEANAELQRAWLIRAALICHRSWRENVSGRRERNLGLWQWLIRKTNWPVAIAEFRIYREEGAAGPPSPSQEDYVIAAGLQNDEPGRELGGSYLARLLAWLARSRVDAGLGFETPFDVPLGLALHLHYSELEAEGQARIANARELQVRAEMAEHRRAIAEEREKNSKVQQATPREDSNSGSGEGGDSAVAGPGRGPLRTGTVRGPLPESGQLASEEDFQI